MDIRFLGGAREVGRSAILVNDRLLLDYGMLTGNPPQFPVDTPEPDAVVVSHGHLDHVGAVPSLLSGDRRPPIHWTPPTRELALTLAQDTLKLRGISGRGATGGSQRQRRRGGTYDCPFTEEEVRRVTQVSETHGYRETFEAAGHEVTFYNAGHIPGSAHVLIDDGDTRLFYTADFHTDDQRLVSASTARPDADVVICESTYSDVEHERRQRIEKRFVESVRTAVWEGGTVVVPAFAIGRTQEMLLVCAANDIDCYVDGMGKQVTKMLRRHPEFVRDEDALRRAKSNARFVTGRDGQRRRIAKQNTVIVTTSGMLSGGPAMTYVPEIRSNPTNKITLTGYQVEGTPGRDLLERGRAEIDGQVMPVSAQVEWYDFSAHADRDGLLELLSAYREVPILVNHGDRCDAFADELNDDGFDASAPKLGEKVTVN
ncbi:MBL fold metallo-hydrolase [Halogeometricum borinquense]|uniref:MBL fold metallo-hydrolase n=1 Tax=Halogeometricum borinquense TaxID=60847 RepID=A0A6C0UQD4_9EURY|nr:MBL fold metallo-hydrolase [Halogeometricum borinquense]QIB76581.1 MBL fold metallo-hydrolase [Halogeometricum borinquense]QIQ77685.1 MBL fold metallo-hydrolase [Halogeometricum borinquense]